MTLPTYDGDKHHVGLGEDEDSLYGLMVEGAYRRTLQVGSTPSVFGSSTDFLNLPSLARWTQDDFTGGSFKWQWGDDNAMFGYCTNMLPVLLDKTIRTVPPVVAEKFRNDSSDIVLAFFYGATFFLVRPTVVQKYDEETLSFLEVDIPGATSSRPCTAAAYDAGAGYLYFAIPPTTTEHGKLTVLTVPELFVPARTAVVTVSAPGSDAEVTHTAHGLTVGDVIFFDIEKVDPKDPDEEDAHLPEPLTESTFYWIVDVVDADHYKIAGKPDTEPQKIKAVTDQSGVFTAYYRPELQEVGYEPTRHEIEWKEELRLKSIDVMATGHSFIAVVADDNRLLTLSLGASKAGEAAWTENTRIPAPWKGYAIYNGIIYILSSDDFNNTRLFTFDGANFIPITDFPYNFRGDTIGIYAGRVYIGGAGRDIAGAASYPELYEVTGSSLRLVKTFTPEVRDTPESTPFRDCTTISAMAAHEGILHLAFPGYGLVGYDVVTDSLYGSSQFEDDIPGQEILWIGTAYQTLNLWVRSSNGEQTGIYRMASLAEQTDAYEGQLVTSDFAPEPARDKRWSQLYVRTRYGAVELEYSVDGGETYTALTGTETADGHYRVTVADLSDVPVSRSLRFRFTFPMQGEDSSSYTELVAFSVGFLFLDSGKYSWAFSINGADRVQAKDTSTVIQDPAAIGAQLRQWADDRTALTYTDVDGNTAKVSITRFEDFKPVVGLPLPDNRGLEGFFNLTLTEV